MPGVIHHGGYVKPLRNPGGSVPRGTVRVMQWMLPLQMIMSAVHGGTGSTQVRRGEGSRPPAKPGAAGHMLGTVSGHGALGTACTAKGAPLMPGALAPTISDHSAHSPLPAAPSHGLPGLEGIRLVQGILLKDRHDHL